jgi:hypothetical protein
MKRITVQDVRRAYEVTGLKPTNCDWGDGVKCGCPLTAVLVGSGLNPDFIEVHACKLYDNEAYYQGFVNAIDGDVFGCTVEEDDAYDKYESGWNDGRAVRAAIFGDTACAE